MKRIDYERKGRMKVETKEIDFIELVIFSLFKRQIKLVTQSVDGVKGSIKKT